MVVGVAAVDDRNHLDDQTLVDDPADHAVLATTGGKQRGERFAQRLADPAQLLTKGSHDEREGGGCHLLGVTRLVTALGAPACGRQSL